MELTIVNKEIAKQLKNVGFDIKLLKCYIEIDDEIYYNKEYKTNWNDIRRNNIYSAPTIALVIKWLRCVHNIIIEIKFNTISFEYRLFNPFKSSNYFTEYYNTNSYEEAEQDAILKAIEILKLK